MSIPTYFKIVGVISINGRRWNVGDKWILKFDDSFNQIAEKQIILFYMLGIIPIPQLHFLFHLIVSIKQHN